jgi:hypothetical protein
MRNKNKLVFSSQSNCHLMQSILAVGQLRRKACHDEDEKRGLTNVLKVNPFHHGIN